jgi:GT2 family glycosyltransferase
VLSILVVNYRSWDDVARLTRSLAATDEITRGLVELIVIDNDSGGAMPAILDPPPRGVRVILRDDNGGFAVGVNAGWRVSRGRWLLLLNPDVIVPADLARRVLDRIAHHESRTDGGPPGVIGFALTHDDGSPQPSVGHEPSLPASLAGLLRPRASRKYRALDRIEPGPVPWVTGAFALVSSRRMAELGGFDESFFLYYEEVDFCRRVRDAGGRVEFDPSVSVVHLRPLQGRRLTPGLRLITRHSKLLYYRKHLPGWQARALAAILRVEAALGLFRATITARPDHARAWRLQIDLVRRLARDESIPAARVRDWAASLATTSVIESTSIPHAGTNPISGPSGHPPGRENDPCRSSTTASV